MLEKEYELQQIDEVAAEVWHQYQHKKVWAFNAQMGSGKTTFIHALCEVLQVKDYVSSPTFSIINEYESAIAGTIYHIDLYRLNNETEAVNAGVEECFISNNYCFVEWPERASLLLPADVLQIEISTITQTKRKLIIK